MTRWLGALLLGGCWGSYSPPPRAPDPGRSTEIVVATLKEAGRLHTDHRSHEARAAWLRAHRLFESDVEPTLRATLNPRDVARLEYQFGRIRARLDHTIEDDPRPIITALASELDTAAPQPPEEAAPSEGE